MSVVYTFQIAFVFLTNNILVLCLCTDDDFEPFDIILVMFI